MRPYGHRTGRCILSMAAMALSIEKVSWMQKTSLEDDEWADQQRRLADAREVFAAHAALYVLAMAAPLGPQPVPDRLLVVRRRAGRLGSSWPSTTRSSVGSGQPTPVGSEGPGRGPGPVAAGRLTRVMSRHQTSWMRKPRIDRLASDRGRASMIRSWSSRREWLVERPAARIPSHGTDLLGQRYAHDLVRTDHRRGRTRDATAGQPVHATFDGVIVQAVDGVASAGGSMWTSTRNSRRAPTSTARLVTCSKLAGRQALLVGAIGAGIVVRAPKGRDPVHGVRWSAA